MASKSNDPADLDNVFAAVGEFFGEPEPESSGASTSLAKGAIPSGGDRRGARASVASGAAAGVGTGTKANLVSSGGSSGGIGAGGPGGSGGSGGGSLGAGGSGASGSGSRATSVEWQPRPFGKKLPLALAALGLLGAGVAHGAVTKGRVEDDLRQDALAKLRSQYPGLDVRFNGRDATISGSVPDLAAKKKAHDLVRNITGVRHVSDPKLVVGSAAAAAPAVEDSVGLTDTIAAEEPTTEGAIETAAPDPTEAAPTESPTTEASVPETDAPSSETSAAEAPAAPAVEGDGQSTTSVPGIADTLPSAPPAIDADQANADAPSLAPITFAKNVASLDASADPAISQIVDFMQANPDVELAVSGYTDSSGTSMTNRAVSTARAQAVRDALIAAGIAPDRITALGYGSRNPVASNDTEDGRAANRRVEFRFFSGDTPDGSGADDVFFTG